MGQSIKLGNDAFLDWSGVSVDSSGTTLNNWLGYKDKTFTNKTIGSTGYTALGTFYSDIGVPSGAYILSYYIRGWSGASLPVTILSGSDGNTLYVGGSAQTITSISVRVFYVKTV